MSQHFKLQLLTGLYISALIGANFLGGKIWEIVYPQWLQTLLSPLDNLVFQFGNQTVVPFSSTSLSFSVGLFAFPITFIITDILTEVKGKKAAQETFYIGLICVIFILLYSILAVNLPSAIRYNIPISEGANFTKPEAYNFIFGTTLRFIFASLIAIGVSQFLDIYLFQRIKKATQGKFLWLRNNLSTIASQFIDTVLFYLIAFTKLPFAISFLGIEANSGLDFDFIIRLFIPYFILKVVFSFFDTPFVYAGVWWLKRGLSKSETTEIKT
jgi:uncharacterized integral membrane protein (TIGR00697 family)